MSRCFYRELEANNITFLPEGLFDNLINLELLWVNTSLFSLSNKLKRLSPKEPRDQPEVIGRTQGLKTSNSEDKFIYCCQILLYVLLKPVSFNRTQVICGVICALYKGLFAIFHCTYLLCKYHAHLNQSALWANSSIDTWFFGLCLMLSGLGNFVVDCRI